MTTRILPWAPGDFPLMLAPMQGVTNRIVRRYFIDTVRPDVVFTEFVRVSGVDKTHIPRRDKNELADTEGGVPLVVQLIGHRLQQLVEAAEFVAAAGVTHINLNLGCPFGRTSSGVAGGNMLLRPEILPELFAALRAAIPGTFSIKLRAGYADPRQIFSLLPVIEQAGVDFIILHPRTVVQKYTGRADHALTAEVVKATALPVIANGDIVTAEQGLRLREQAAPAGLMLGRGAIADPQLFARLRGVAPAHPTAEQVQRDIARMLLALLPEYRVAFCGDAQVLGKLKSVLGCLESDALQPMAKTLRRARTLAAFVNALGSLGPDRF